MKNRLVTIQPVKTLIKPNEGWSKKLLADVKVDLLGLCGFRCPYCSTNTNSWHRIHSPEFVLAVKDQLGIELTGNPALLDPSLSYVFPDVVAQLKTELDGYKKKPGKGLTLAFGCLVDNISPSLVMRSDENSPSIAEQCLTMLLKRTDYRIRITTKNAAIGNKRGIELLSQWRDRVVVGLSIGTIDDNWARAMEGGTSSPTKRIQAMRALQDAGIPTFGMLCPVFPGAVKDVDAILDGIRAERCERVWSEPYNDRSNWKNVKGCPDTESDLARMFGPDRKRDAWGDYAVDLYTRLRVRAVADGWSDKLAYMLYESGMEAMHVRAFSDLSGVLLQSVDRTGRSKNPHFAEIQDRLRISAWDRLAADG
jgi:DNA repair photolyase